jgi:protein-tyrosine kinase
LATKTESQRLVTHTHSESRVSEQYRTIRTNIGFTSIDHKDRTLLITSPAFGEGKSITTANLAASFAQKGDKILVIDANLRNPSLHSIFHINNTVGLTHILKGERTFKDAISQTEIERVDVLTSGSVPSNPAELLDSQAMKELMQTALEHYEMVLLDSSPVLEYTDSTILANQCDGVLLVLCNKKTKSQKAIEAKRLLEFARAKLIGVIFNRKD